MLGYKQTEVEVIPEDWVVRAMGSIGEPLIGLTYDPSDVREFGTLVLRSSNIQDGKLSFDDSVFVEMNVPDRAITKFDDILICVRNGSRLLIGKCALIDEKTAGSAFGAFMSVYRSEFNGFIFFQFQARSIKNQINQVLGATINQITNRDLIRFQIPLPPTKAEQQTIANALSDADALIESLEQLIVKKRQIKQGTIQELLTGKKRLPGFSVEWEVKRLGSLGFFLKGSGIKKEEARNGVIPCIRYGEIYTQHDYVVTEYISHISREVASTAVRLKPGDILFAGSGETKEEIGKCVAFVDDIEAYAGGDIVILRPARAHATFLGYYLNTVPIVRQKATKGQGDAVVHISSAALADIEIKIPETDEQNVIASILVDMDAEITALESKLLKARQIKQGMMHNLLTGRIRLV